MAKNVIRKNDDMNLDEVYRQLRTNIEFSQMDETLRSINVLSTNPNEGKSSVSLNLAKIFADKYQKVLLIDCDLRNPSLNKFLRVSNSKGLTNLLTHYQKGDLIQEQDELKIIDFGNNTQLYFLSTGSKVPNPTEVISSRRFSTFINEAKKQFDAVIVDCPSVFAVADGIPISHVVDGTLFVLSAKDTDKYDAREAIQDLQRNGANLIGVVMTKVPGFRSKHYYGYGYGKYGGYGDSND
mgnify:CR=1 FL=1